MAKGLPCARANSRILSVAWSGCSPTTREQEARCRRTASENGAPLLVLLSVTPELPAGAAPPLSPVVVPSGETEVSAI